MHEVPGTIHGLSASGWLDRELFQEWFYGHFLQHLPSSRSLLPILDGHSSHHSLECIREASLEGGMIVFFLQPHTTDASAFQSLKMDSESDKFMSAHIYMPTCHHILIPMPNCHHLPRYSLPLYCHFNLLHVVFLVSLVVTQVHNNLLTKTGKEPIINLSIQFGRILRNSYQFCTILDNLSGK